MFVLVGWQCVTFGMKGSPRQTITLKMKCKQQGVRPEIDWYGTNGAGLFFVQGNESSAEQEICVRQNQFRLTFRYGDRNTKRATLLRKKDKESDRITTTFEVKEEGPKIAKRRNSSVVFDQSEKSEEQPKRNGSWGARLRTSRKKKNASLQKIAKQFNTIDIDATGKKMCIKFLMDKTVISKIKL